MPTGEILGQGEAGDPNSRIMIHQPLGGAKGQATDIQIQAKEIERMKELTSKILSETTGKPVEEIYRDTERDNFMSPEEEIGRAHV